MKDILEQIQRLIYKGLTHPDLCQEMMPVFSKLDYYASIGVEMADLLEPEMIVIDIEEDTRVTQRFFAVPQE